MSRNRLFFDIETSPCLGWFWRPGYKLNLDYNNVIENAKIICISYKWEHSDKIYSLTWDKNQCDKEMIKKFIQIMDKSDEIIGHNSDKFDEKWLRTRAAFWGFDMMPKYTSLDTLKAARTGFNFPSNRLDAIGRYLGVGKKIKTTGELWWDVWHKNSRKALKEMVAYCEQDVLLLEAVFNHLNKYIKHKSRATNDKLECPEGHKGYWIRTRRITASATRNVQLQCKTCGKHWTLPESTYDKLTK